MKTKGLGGKEPSIFTFEGKVNRVVSFEDEKTHVRIEGKRSLSTFFVIALVVGMISASMYYFYDSYGTLRTHWATLTSWKFPQDAFNESGEDEILWANVYQIVLGFVAIVISLYLDCKPTFVLAMISFTIFGFCHITAHITLHVWTYLPLHYSFVGTGIFIGLTFHGIKSFKTILCFILVDFVLIQGIGQFFGVLSAFSIMVVSLRHHVRIMLILSFGQGLIWFGLLFNDVITHGAHGTTEVLACIGLTLGGIALVLHPDARKSEKSVVPGDSTMQRVFKRMLTRRDV